MGRTGVGWPGPAPGWPDHSSKPGTWTHAPRREVARALREQAESRHSRKRRSGRPQRSTSWGPLGLAPRTSHQLATDRRVPAPGATKCLWEVIGRLDWVWAARIVIAQRKHDVPRSGGDVSRRTRRRGIMRSQQQHGRPRPRSGSQQQHDRPRSGESTAARKDTEKESFMAKERGDYRQDAHTNNRSHVSGTPLSGGG